jgi:hypothetical protein
MSDPFFKKEGLTKHRCIFHKRNDGSTVAFRCFPEEHLMADFDLSIVGRGDRNRSEAIHHCEQA